MPPCPEMSENIARMQSLYAAYAAGNRTAFNALLAEDVRWYSGGPAELPWTGLREGREAVFEYFRVLEREAVVESYTPEHSICDDDWLILLGTLRVRLGDKDEPRDYPKVDVLRFRNGQIVEFREFYDTASALAHYRAARAA